MLDTSIITPQVIEEAYQIVKPYIIRTPYLPFDCLNKKLSKQIWLKCENLQKTGAFKMRGSAHCILRNHERAKKHGVICASAGNHAQGVAAVAQQLGIQATIVMPTFTPPLKVHNTKNYGARVELFGEVYDEAYQRAYQISQEQGQVFIHAFKDPYIITGQGTLGLELLEEENFKSIEAVIVSVGGGGLSSGVAVALKARRPDLKIYGVTTQHSQSMWLSLRARKVVEASVKPTIAEGVASKKSELEMVEFLIPLLTDCFSIEEDRIVEAISLLSEQGKLTVEGAGALPVAALMAGLIPEKNVCAILSGGNIDTPVLTHVLQKGLVLQSRLVRLSVPISDKPGGLNQITEILASTQANIIQIFHERTKVNKAFHEAEVEVDIETKGAEHLREIIDTFRSKNIHVTQVV